MREKRALGNGQEAAVENGTMRIQHKSIQMGSESSAQVRQRELQTTKAAHFPDSSETLGSLGAVKEARRENSRIATGRAEDKVRQILRPGEGSTETMDHGKPASKPRWGRWVKQWRRER